MATITVTPIRSFTSGETVTPTKLNELAQSNVSISDIAFADLSSAAQQAIQGYSTPAGAVMPFAMNSAPSGWLACNGAAVSRATYATLFAAIGTAHGAGDGNSTFNVPNLQGIFVRGSGSQTINSTTYSATFAQKQQDAFKSHTHSAAGQANTLGTFGSNSGYSSSSAGTTGATGDTETRPVNIALLYCIKT